MRGISIDSIGGIPSAHLFAVCIHNEESPTLLERREIYGVLPDGDAAQEGGVRVVDESGEDDCCVNAKSSGWVAWPRLCVAMSLR